MDKCSLEILVLIPVVLSAIGREMKAPSYNFLNGWMFAPGKLPGPKKARKASLGSSFLIPLKATKTVLYFKINIIFEVLEFHKP